MTGILRPITQSIPEVQDARNLKLSYARLLEVMQASAGVQKHIEWYFNNSKTSYHVRKYVTGFVEFLRTQLDVNPTSLPDAWVIKSFGFNLDVDYSDVVFPEEPVEIIYPGPKNIRNFPYVRMSNK